MAHGCTERKLITDEDFDKFALSTYEQAVDFMNTSVLILNVYSGFPAVAITNATFSIELFFKSIFYRQNHTKCYRNGKSGIELHNLYILFKRLPIDLQKEITKNHRCTNITRDNFERSLEQIGDHYTAFRYSSEQSFISCNLVFIFELLFACKMVCDRLFLVGEK